MGSVGTRGRFALGVVAVGVLTAFAAGCTPPPEPPATTTTTSTTTTTTTTLPELPAQCVDNTRGEDDFPGADYYYTGVPNVAGNMQMHESYDGTCSGPRPPHTFHDYTAVFATTYLQAEALCAAAGGTGTSGTWKSQDWVAMGDYAWVCNAQP